MGTQGLKRTIKNKPNVNACAEIHFPMKIPDLSKHLYQPEKKLAFLQIQVWKPQFPRFFRQIVQFQVIKNLLKKYKIK